jgi:pimeloyl-ACP methyl ester carboxylesterase
MLDSIQQPSLFIVGGNDMAVLKANRTALESLGAREKHLEVVPHATHLFEESGKCTIISVKKEKKIKGIDRPLLYSCRNHVLTR